MANTGNSGKDQEINGDHVMAENSQPSMATGRRRTTRTEPLTPDQALEILQQAVLECQRSGISVGVSTLYRAGARNVIVVMEDVDLVSGNFVLAKNAESKH